LYATAVIWTVVPSDAGGVQTTGNPFFASVLSPIQRHCS
jgi:hypothetical protein